ncbi:MAG TPA: YerC/YecD family TrpR-related protein [Candidatus Paceibacterota bacterium]
MPRIRRTITNKKEREKRLEALYEAVLLLRGKEECAAFLRDLCTMFELDAMAERLLIARLIAKDIAYRGISGDTGASTTTVSRVSHWYHHGTGGYRTVISRMHK